jgi:uncharacterized protein (DUF2336 family)
MQTRVLKFHQLFNNYLIKSLAPKEKALVVELLSFYLKNGYLQQEETKINAILERITEDDIEVKKQLVAALGNSAQLPKNIAIKLVYEAEEEIAVPLLENYPLFHEGDLKKFLYDFHFTRVNSIASEKGLAIVRRHDLPEAISRLIMSAGDKAMVKTLLDNHTVVIDMGNYKDMLKLFRNDIHYLKKLAERRNIDKNFFHTLLDERMPGMKDLLNTEGEIDGALSPSLLRISETIQERFCLSKEQILERRAMVEEMLSKNTLNSALTLKFLCTGDIFSFLYSMSVFLEIPYNNIQEAFLNCDEEKLVSLYSRTQFNQKAAQMLAKLSCIISQEAQYKPISQREFKHRLIPCLQESAIDDPTIRYFVSIIG